MTRAELRAKIRSEMERQGYAAVSTSELWAAFNAPGEETSLSFDDALGGFAAVNGWAVRPDASSPADAFVFHPGSQGPPPPGG